MLGRLVWFIGYTIIAFLIAWLLVTVIEIVPVIPEALKNVLKVVIWVVALISIILLGMRMFVGNNTMGPPTP